MKRYKNNETAPVITASEQSYSNKLGNTEVTIDAKRIIITGRVLVQQKKDQ